MVNKVLCVCANRLSDYVYAYLTCICKIRVLVLTFELSFHFVQFAQLLVKEICAVGRGEGKG